MGGSTFTIQYSHRRVVALGGGALGLAPAVTGALSGFSLGTIQTAYANAIYGRPWYEGVTQSGFVGAAGGIVAGYVMGQVMPRLPGKGAAAVVSRMAMGGLVGGGVSGGTQVAINVATGRPWDEGLGPAIGVGWTTGSLGAFMDYYGGRLMDRQLGRRPVRGLAGEAEGGPSRPGFWERAWRLLADEGGYFAPWLDADDVPGPRLGGKIPLKGDGTDLPTSLPNRPGDIEWVRIADLEVIHGPEGRGHGGTGVTVEEAMEFLQREGWDPNEPVPVMITQSGRKIIGGGHHRLEAARRLGYTEVPARVNRETINDPNAWYYRQLEGLADAYAASVRPPTKGKPPQGMEWIDIDKILPQHAPDTPNWVEKLKRSIEQKGYDFLEVERRGGEHITVTKVPKGAYEGFYVLTAGHHRVQALKELGYRQVPVVFGPPELWQGHLYTAIQFKVYGPRWFNRSLDERDFGEDSLKALGLVD